MPRKLLLLGWAGADWQLASPLVDAGAMPQFARLLEQGASGRLASLPPFSSPALWTSVATGRRPHRHGLLGPAPHDRRQSPALWDLLGRAGLTAHVVGWPATHPAETVTGACVSDAWTRPSPPGAPAPFPSDALHPPALAAELADLRVAPGDLDPGVLRLLLPQLAGIDLRREQRPLLLAHLLAELYTAHNAAIALLDRGPWHFLAVHYPFLARVCDAFLDFHPPRRPHISEREFAWFQHVVAGAYRLQDLLLADLLQHAGPGTAALVCSEHGFLTGDQRPRLSPSSPPAPSAGHRTQGLFAFAGPGIVRDTLLPRARLLDLAPTILHFFGLPIAADLDGQPLAAAFVDSTPPRPNPPGETTPTLAPRSPEAPPANTTDAFADRETRWLRALSLADGGAHEEALALLEDLHFAFPEEPRYALQLALAQLRLGLLDHAAASAATLLDASPDDARVDLVRAEIALLRGDAATALTHAQLAARRGPESPLVTCYRGRAFVLLGRWAEAAEAFRAVLLAQPDDPHAWLGLAHVFLQAGDPAEAERCARETLGLDPANAFAAFTLARALAAQGREADATTAFARTLELDPDYAARHRHLLGLRDLPAAAVAHENHRTAALRRLHEAALARLARRHRELDTYRAATAPVHLYVPPGSAAPAASAFPVFSPPVSGSTPTPWTVRPPWPDELPRLAAVFPQLNLARTGYPLVLVATGEPERLIGVGALASAPAAASAAVHGFVFAVQPRFAPTPAAEALLAAALRRARDIGAHRLETTDDLRDGDPRLPLLERAGFATFRLDEFWQVPIAEMQPRLERIHAKLAASGRLTPFVVASLTPDDLPAVRSLVAADGLVAPESITLAPHGAPSRIGAGYDPELSCLVRCAGEAVGVTLIRRQGRTAITEVRVVAPAWRGVNAANHLLFHRGVALALAAGMEFVVFTATTGKQDETIQMARRFGGTRLARLLRLAVDLD